MAEVADWSPIDDDNNSAPPVGAPEGMMPSAVNNTMRAMMGSLRRNHDTIIAGTTALPYLPSAGGVVSGNVAINGTGGVALGATQLRNISGGLEVYNATGGSITSRGPGASFIFGNRDQVSPAWYLYAAGGAAFLDNGSTGIVLSMTNAGDLAISGSINTIKYEITDTLFAERSGDNGHLIYDADGQLALALYGAAGGNTNYYRANTHNFQNNAGAGIVNIATDGTINATGLGITGNVGVSGGVTAGALVATGNITAGNGSTGGNITSTYPGQFVGNACNIANGTFANIDASDIDCLGNIEAVTYTKSGVPVFALTEAEFAALNARIEALETQLKELTHV